MGWSPGFKRSGDDRRSIYLDVYRFELMPAPALAQERGPFERVHRGKIAE